MLATTGLLTACANHGPDGTKPEQVSRSIAGSKLATGTLPSGAQWQSIVPSNWNGTLLVWSRGYEPTAKSPDAAPAEFQDLLLAKGYALLASNYGSGGWSLSDAVPAQRAAIETFVASHGKPRRIIGWGASMGSLVTVELAEQITPLNGAIALCPSIGGAIGMMNMALDGAFTFRTLVAPQAGIELTRISNDFVNGDKVRSSLSAAMATPDGRARVALAAVLGGVPGWTSVDQPEPKLDDYEKQVDNIAATFAMAVFPPRQDQEKRASGGFSWNNGVDYRAQLALSGRRAFVEALYRKAGLSLDADLAVLAQTQRIFADPDAVSYMTSHYTPTALPQVPVLALQTVGDGITSPSLQSAYTDAAPPRMAMGLWIRGAGHCRFDPSAIISALSVLEHRLDKSVWPPLPDGMVEHRPAPMLRPYFQRAPKQ